MKWLAILLYFEFLLLFVINKSNNTVECIHIVVPPLCANVLCWCYGSTSAALLSDIMQREKNDDDENEEEEEKNVNVRAHTNQFHFYSLFFMFIHIRLFALYLYLYLFHSICARFEIFAHFYRRLCNLRLQIQQNAMEAYKTIIQINLHSCFS